MLPEVEAALRVVEERCKADPIYFVERFVHIEDKDAEEIIVPFNLWDTQKEALRSVHEHRLNIILKARQLGITWLSLSYAAWVLRFTPGSTVVAMSRTLEEAKELVRRLSVIFENMPMLVREKDFPCTMEKTALTVSLNIDGKSSTFKAFAASEGASRSFTANLVILDEWAFQQYAREIWTSAYPTINRPTGGKVIGLSTIKRGSLFEELWVSDNNFNKIFLSWQTDPRRTKEWYDETLKALGEAGVMAEYPATPEEALTIAGGAFFPEVKAHTHFVDYLPDIEYRRYISIDYGLDALAALFYAVDHQGQAIVYKEVYKSGLIVSEAAEAILDAIGDEKIHVIYAPPDLWNRNRDTGRSTAEIFAKNGLYLTQTSNDREQGWLDVKEWLKPIETRNEHTGEDEVKPRLRLLKGATQELYRCLIRIQRDEHRPNDCAKDPHELTHLPDSLRAFCAGRPAPLRIPKEKKVYKYDPLSTAKPQRAGFFSI
ncbi:MAG: hypothetical protein IIU73_07405 [Selenomonadales bacterium]|nr:hypothetical protein [Selenomonadales bacterium]